jgi:putative heme-binding domain-containing protein
MFAAAKKVSADDAAPTASRTAALKLLLRTPDQRERDLAILAALLAPQTPRDVQAAAVDYLARQNDPQIPELLLAGWTSHTPALRSQILTALAGRPAWTAALLDALAARRLQPGEVDATVRQQLTTHPKAELRDRAVALFEAPDSDRQAVVRAWQVALQLSADRRRGQAVFEKKCAACHKFGSQGQEVGPNLAALTDRSPQGLLTSILDPSRSVEGRFANYVAQTGDGRIVSGLLVEGGSSVTLVGQEGRRETVLRSDLAELRNTGKSLMPDGLEKDLSQQDLADLVLYLQSNP